jgi:Leucine-rich repeat (LRR) protein
MAAESKLLASLLILLYNQVASAQDCPVPCTCQERTVTCDSCFIPSGLPWNTQTLRILNTDATTDEVRLVNLTQLRTLSVRNCAPRSLSGELYVGLESLQTLDLSGNGITEIQESALQVLQNWGNWIWTKTRSAISR